MRQHILVNSSIFWNILPCSPLNDYRHFGGMAPPSSSRAGSVCYLHMLVSCFDPDNGGDVLVFFRNIVDWLSTDILKIDLFLTIKSYMFS